MRIKTELLDKKEHYYNKMPEKQRAFLTDPFYMFYENGDHYFIWWSKRNNNIQIGFDDDGKLFVTPKIYTKNHKMTMTENEIIDLVNMILSWVSSAARNGFLDLEED